MKAKKRSRKRWNPEAMKPVLAPEDQDAIDQEAREHGVSRGQYTGTMLAALGPVERQRAYLQGIQRAAKEKLAAIGGGK